MFTLKRLPVVVACLLCALFIAACGGPSNAGAQGYQAPSTSTQATAAPTSTTQSANTIQGQTTNQKSSQAQTNGNQGSQIQAQGTSNTSKQNSATTANKNTQSSGQTNASQNAQNNTQSNANQGTNNQAGANTLVKVVQANVNGQMMSILTTGTGMTLYYRTSDPTPASGCTGGCAKTWPPFLTQGTLIPSAGIQSGQLTVQRTANGNQVEYNGHPLYTYVGDGAPGQVTGQGNGNVWYTVSVTTQAQHW